jgi:hypothetical protein
MIYQENPCLKEGEKKKKKKKNRIKTFRVVKMGKKVAQSD